MTSGGNSIDDPSVVLAATPRGWGAALHAHAADHGGIIVRATVLTPADAREEACDVVIVDDITSFLSASLVADLHDRGRAVLGVFDPEDSRGKGELVEVGVDALIAKDATPEELVTTIRGLRGNRSHVPASEPGPPIPSRPAGSVIGVLGPEGGVGITEVAIELAAILGTGGCATILLDADEIGPAVAQRLGLPPHPNLLGTIDAVRRRGEVAEGLQRLSRRHPLAAVVGMADPEDWSVIPSGGLADTLTALAGHCRRLVVDLGHVPATAMGSTGPRYGHVESALAACDALVLVTAPTPVAVARTLRLASRLEGVDLPMHMLLNRDTGDRFARDQAVAELTRGLGQRVLAVLPEDRRVAKAAWQGERVSGGRFARVLSKVVEALTAGHGPRAGGG